MFLPIINYWNFSVDNTVTSKAKIQNKINKMINGKEQTEFIPPFPELKQEMLKVNISNKQFVYQWSDQTSM